MPRFNNIDLEIELSIYKDRVANLERRVGYGEECIAAQTETIGNLRAQIKALQAENTRLAARHKRIVVGHPDGTSAVLEADRYETFSDMLYVYSDRTLVATFAAGQWISAVVREADV